MTDVLKIAQDRRAELREEVARIDDFIRMADSLMRKVPPREDRPEPAERAASQPRDVEDTIREDPAVSSGDTASPATSSMAAGITRMNLMRRGPTAVSG